MESQQSPAPLSPELRSTLETGDFAERYQAEGFLGRGGMGWVVAARRRSTGAEVAIKFLPPEAMATPGASKRLLREVRAAARFKSPYAVRVLDVGRLCNGAPFLAMERLEGQTLAERLHSEGPLPLPIACTFMLQACHAIAEAHSFGVIHRDIKPANLFVTRAHCSGSSSEPTIKVLDWGIARLAHLDQDTSLTASGISVGSPRYMSPEQVRAAPLDLRTDIWSLGVSLYQLLTARMPFESDVASELFAKIVADPPVTLESRLPHLPPEVSSLVAACLIKDREQRTLSLAEFANALEPFAGEGASRLCAGIRGFEPHCSVLPAEDKGASRKSLLPLSEDLVETEHDVPPRHLLNRPAQVLLVSSQNEPRVVAPAPDAETAPSSRRRSEGVPSSGSRELGITRIGSTMAYRIQDNYMVLVHSTAHPATSDWDDYVLKTSTMKLDALLILAPKGFPGPNALQRRQGADAWKFRDAPPPIAVLTSSPIHYGIITAFNWFLNGSLRAYSPLDWKGALSYLGMTPSQRSEIVVAAKFLAVNLGVTPLFARALAAGEEFVAAGSELKSECFAPNS